MMRNHYLKLRRGYICLIIALVPTLLGYNGDGMFYAYGRIISLFLVIIGLHMIMQCEGVTTKVLENLFEIFAFFSGILMVISVFIDPVSSATTRMTGVYLNSNFLSCISAFSALSSLGLFYIRRYTARRWIYLVFFLCLRLLRYKFRFTHGVCVSCCNYLLGSYNDNDG